jgi:hypothetical protein
MELNQYSQYLHPVVGQFFLPTQPWLQSTCKDVFRVVGLSFDIVLFMPVRLVLPHSRKVKTTIDYRYLNLLKPTGHVMHYQKFNIQQLYALPHTVFMCFVFIWEQTATCTTYSINWLVFITQMKRVYSAVRTRSLNKAYWSRDAPTA